MSVPEDSANAEISAPAVFRRGRFDVETIAELPSFLRRQESRGSKQQWIGLHFSDFTLTPTLSLEGEGVLQSCRRNP